MIELARRRMMMGGSTKPYDAEVEYLVAHYVPLYFPSGILMKRGYDFGIKIANLKAFSELSSSNYWCPFIGTKNTNQKALVFVTSWNNPSTKGRLAVDWRDSTTGEIGGINISSADTIYEIKFLNIGNNKVGFYVNNTKYREFTYFDFPNNSNSAIGFCYPQKIYFYFAYIYNFFVRDEYGQYLFNAVPVRKGQTAYMYDEVSKRYIYNQLSDLPFTPGPDKTA